MYNIPLTLEGRNNKWSYFLSPRWNNDSPSLRGVSYETAKPRAANPQSAQAPPSSPQSNCSGKKHHSRQDKQYAPIRSPRNWPYVSFSATSSSTTSKRLPPVLTAETAAANSSAATLRSDHIITGNSTVDVVIVEERQLPCRGAKLNLGIRSLVLPLWGQVVTYRYMLHVPFFFSAGAFWNWPPCRSSSEAPNKHHDFERNLMSPSLI